MIKAKQKPMEEIINSVKDYKRLLVTGCNGCVTVCEAGGQKEAGILASALRMYFAKEGANKQIDDVCLTRHCDPEYFDELKDKIENYDAVLNMACGAGVQLMAETFEAKPILPAVDTCFIGVGEQEGVWRERCQACGECVLGQTGGICPIARCSKRMLNGPCGGSEGGKCELSVVMGKEVPCAWHLIYERLKTLGQMEKMFSTPWLDKDWTVNRDGGPREIIKEDAKL